MLQTGEVISIEYDDDKVTKLMKAMDKGFYKMNTEARLVDYEKIESENCSW
ncbi:hypothetical protein [Clostridium sp.]|uniref:hypothetical protein n=1 Tax=Clostridium sp. TaxID=1506 RepID=UPI003D6C9673